MWRGVPTRRSPGCHGALPRARTCCTCSRTAAGWPGSPRSRSAAGSSAPALSCSPAPPGPGTEGTDRAHGWGCGLRGGGAGVTARAAFDHSRQGGEWSPPKCGRQDPWRGGEGPQSGRRRPPPPVPQMLQNHGPSRGQSRTGQMPHNPLPPFPCPAGRRHSQVLRQLPRLPRTTSPASPGACECGPTPSPG